MSDLQRRIEELRADYAALFDPDTPTASHAIEFDLEDAPDYSDLAFSVRTEFARTGAVAVEVRTGGELLGVATRENVGEPGGTLATGDAVPVGTGDHATLTGESGQYRAIRYTCSDGRHEAFRVFHDARQLPTCPDGKTMGLAGWI